MNFSKLSSNEKLAVYGAVAAIIGAFLSFGGGGTFGLLTGIAMLVIIFLPQFSPSTNLPGSKGSLMMIVGGIGVLGAVFSLLTLLSVMGAFGLYGGTWLIGLLLSAAGGLLMGWASWQEFQGEGGKFNIGTAATPSAPAPPPQQAAPAPPPPPAAPMSSGQTVSPPLGSDQSDEDRSL